MNEERDQQPLDEFPRVRMYLSKNHPELLERFDEIDRLYLRISESSLKRCSGCQGYEECRQEGSPGMVAVVRPGAGHTSEVAERAMRSCLYRRQHQKMIHAPTTPAQGGGASRDFTLANFIEDEGNGAALREVRRYLDKPNERIEKGTSVVLYGLPGTGKTHLVSALTWGLLKRGVAVAYITFPQYLESLRSRYGTNDPGCVLEIATVPVLVIDDLTVENVTPWVKDVLGVMVDARIQPEKLPTIITTNHSPGQIADRYNDRIASRLGKRFYKWIPVVGKDRRKT